MQRNKFLSLCLVLLLIVCLCCTGLMACSTKDKDTGNKDTEGTNTGSNLTLIWFESAKIHANDSIIVDSTEDLTESAVRAGISLATSAKASASSEKVSFRVVALGNKQYRISPMSQFDLNGRYEMRLLDDRLSFRDYKQKQIIITITSEDVSNMALSSNVIELSNSGSLSNFTSDGNLNTFIYDSVIGGETLSMGDIVYADNRAYQVAGVEETKDGYQRISYVTPAYDKVYNTFTAARAINLGDGEVVSAEEEAVDEIVNMVSLAGFDVGPVRVDANKVSDDTVELSVEVTIRDVLGDKDGINSVDLILSFDIVSTIDADTNINIGALVAKEDNDISIKANFTNTLTFGVAVRDGVSVDNVEGLDEIITKIKAMVQNDADAVSIPVFNWIVPIGNGVAQVNFQVNAVLDFDFTGKLGVEAVATSGFSTEIAYNPATGESKAEITDKDKLKFESVKVALDGSATLYLGIDAAIKFELLGGVISVGVGAEVGNYNKVYGHVGTSNLLVEAKDINYGAYLEGGIYYDVKFLYAVAKITSGSKSFLGGRQEKPLYDAGDNIVITKVYEPELLFIDDVAKDLVIYVDIENIVTGEKQTKVAADLTKLTIVDMDEAIVIEDGEIKAVGTITDCTIDLKLGNTSFVLTVSAIEVISADTDVGTLAPGEYRLPDGSIVIIQE